MIRKSFEPNFLATESGDEPEKDDDGLDTYPIEECTILNFLEDVLVVSLFEFTIILIIKKIKKKFNLFIYLIIKNDNLFKYRYDK